MESNKMPKPILIIGTQNSGKTLAAKGVGSRFKETVIIDGKNWHERPFQFQVCTENTDCIILDEFISPNEVEYFYGLTANGVDVERLGIKPVVIYPQIVIIINIPKGISNVLQLSQAIKRRFDTIRIGDNNGSI